LLLVIIDTHDPHNVAACMRSAEAFGIQNIDVVTLKQSSRPSPVSRGVDGWLDRKAHTSVDDCVKELRAKGFALAAGYPRQDAVPLSKVPVDKPLAVIFGNEKDGVHSSWLSHLDYAFTIPMFGFVESLNISVSCAISLHDLSQRGRERADFYLSSAEQSKLLNQWICTHIPSFEKQLEILRQQR